MAIQFKNNAQSKLTADIGLYDGIIYVMEEDLANFPNDGSQENPYYLTLIEKNEEGKEVDWEIAKLTAINVADRTIYITRAQEGTVARAWEAGTAIEMRLTAGMLNGFKQGELGGAIAIKRTFEGVINLSKASYQELDFTFESNYAQAILPGVDAFDSCGGPAITLFNKSFRHVVNLVAKDGISVAAVNPQEVVFLFITSLGKWSCLLSQFSRPERHNYPYRLQYGATGNILFDSVGYKFKNGVKQDQQYVLLKNNANLYAFTFIRSDAVQPELLVSGQVSSSVYATEFLRVFDPVDKKMLMLPFNSEGALQAPFRVVMASDDTEEPVYSALTFNTNEINNSRLFAWGYNAQPVSLVCGCFIRDDIVVLGYKSSVDDKFYAGIVEVQTSSSNVFKLLEEVELTDAEVTSASVSSLREFEMNDGDAVFVLNGSDSDVDGICVHLRWSGVAASFVMNDVAGLAGVVVAADADRSNTTDTVVVAYGPAQGSGVPGVESLYLQRLHNTLTASSDVKNGNPLLVTAKPVQQAQIFITNPYGGIVLYAQATEDESLDVYAASFHYGLDFSVEEALLLKKGMASYSAHVVSSWSTYVHLSYVDDAGYSNVDIFKI